MEPVRGGKLAKLDEANETKLKELRPKESTAAWGFRFLQGLPNIKMVLSGMSNMEQMKDNIQTFTEEKTLSETETNLLLDIAEGMKDSIPCTACRYCCDGCPMGLDIPTLLSTYNEVRLLPTINAVMHIEFMEENKKPSACISCGKCTRICPQNIDVPTALKDLTERIKKLPSWKEICQEREAAANKK